MSFTVDIVAAGAQVGGKARSLAELSASGLPTPAGFVVTSDLVRALLPDLPVLVGIDAATLAVLDGLRAQIVRAPWPAGFRDELAARLQALPAVSYAVRSSFASEDRAGGLAAGVYESRVGVGPDSVEAAIREVLCSAFAPGAVAYALAHGDAPLSGPMAVLVHVYLAGSADGSAALVAPTSEAPVVDCRRGSLPAAARAELAAALAALAARRGPVEVEWVHDAGRVVFLQARPYEPPRAARPWPGFRDLDAGDSGSRWRWDVAHNPLPLSPAQVGLVELVDEACRIGIRQRVLGGYLFYAPDDRPRPTPIPAAEAEAFFASLRAEVEARLAELGRAKVLADTLALFVHAYERIFGVLQPALRLAHEGLRGFLAAQAPAKLTSLPLLRAGVPSLAGERLVRAERLACAGGPGERAGALAAYLEVFGDEAGVWDVASPTRAEEPDALLVARHPHAPTTLDWRISSAEVEASIAPELRAEWREHLRLSRVAVALGEADDWIYARLQAAVRRALLATGERQVRRGALAEAADIFYLPLAVARTLDTGRPPPSDLAGLAAEGRRSWVAAAAAPPPVGGNDAGPAVHGIGIGGRAVGRVVLHRPGHPITCAAESVLVAATLLPTELPLVDAAALVVETGGPLDHVAAQARERGLPAVVGARGALAALAPGDLVLVDGDRGLVVRLGP